MLSALLAIWVALAPAPMDRPAKKLRPGFAKTDGLSLSVTLDRKAYGPADEVTLRFVLKNESNRALFIGDSFLSPGYHEAGPGRHFEVHVKAGGKARLYFWSGMLTKCGAGGIRKVFKLKPGEVYKGAIRLCAGTEKAGKLAQRLLEQRGGSFEDRATRKAHVLGKDGRRYTVELRYRVNPQSHGVWQPPADFKDQMLWKGELTSSPLQFAVTGK